jgi:hypothetical protein
MLVVGASSLLTLGVKAFSLLVVPQLHLKHNGSQPNCNAHVPMDDVPQS